MRRIFLSLLAAALATACSTADPSDANEDVGASESHVTEEPALLNFHPQSGCSTIKFQSDYIAEIDLGDRAHPRYRIRHGVGSAGNVIGKQNVNLYLRDGTVWKSPDNLVARRWSIDASTSPSDTEAVLRAYDDASKRDPWDDLPVPKEFLDKAFETTPTDGPGAGMYNLLRWEAVLNYPWYASVDQPCRRDFYFRP